MSDSSGLPQETVKAYLSTLEREVEVQPIERLGDIPRKRTGDRGFHKVDAETLFDEHVVDGLSREELDQIRSDDGSEFPAVWNELLSHLLPDKLTEACQDPTLPDPVEESK